MAGRVRAPGGRADGGGPDAALLRAVPPGPLRLLACGGGDLGAALKAQDHARTVFGADHDPEAGSLDGLLFADVLEHLADPLAALKRLRPLLKPGGFALVGAPNAQHWTLAADLLRADLQYRAAGLLDRAHLRLFTYADSLKLLLDAGFAPRIVDEVRVPAPEAFHAAAEPLLRHLGLHPGRTRRYLDVYQYVIRGDLLPDAGAGEGADEPLTFAACVSDRAVLGANLMASPCLAPGTPHELLVAERPPSAAEGLAACLARAKHRLVVLAHQDVYLPEGWPGRFLRSWQAAERAFGPVGVAGVYGTVLGAGGVERAGRVVDRDRLLWEPAPLPAAVEALDELLLAVPRDTPLRPDPALGFHLYGADLCLRARRRGLAAVALDALCLHHSRGAGLPEAFAGSARQLARTWRDRLPVATPCAVIGDGGEFRVVG